MTTSTDIKQWAVGTFVPSIAPPAPTMEGEMIELNVNDVVYREDLYPRLSPDHAMIERYAGAIKYLPAIQVNQNNILIDGYHRWQAHRLAEQETIKVDIIETSSEAELEILAYRLNSNHGMQLTTKEKQRFARRQIDSLGASEIGKILSVNEKTIRRWTEQRRRELKDERNQAILDLYLHAKNTQEIIAETIGTTHQTVSNVLDGFAKNGQMSEICKDFQPYLYNIWKLGKSDNETDYFGHFPVVCMENVLFYHTQMFDVIYDPFAGSGTTADICRKWYRRFYCSDLNVIPGREADIKPWDIANGLPADLPKPDLAFLDPPYWKQAEGQYSKQGEDLGNMSLDDFESSMRAFLQNLVEKKTTQIAIVIQPTQYSNELVYEDHVFFFDSCLRNDYRIKMRYILPYSTQQYNPQQVEKAKQENVCLALHRDLVIWERCNHG